MSFWKGVGKLTELIDVYAPSHTDGSAITWVEANQRYEEVAGGGGGQSNTASNIGVGGVGLYQQKISVDLQFRNINAADSKITVALDAGNNEVDIGLGTVNFDDLSDIVITAIGDGELISFNSGSGTWINQTTAELSILTDDLFSGNGLLVRTGSLTFAERTITGTSNEISVTNGNGVSANPTIGLANDAVLPGNGAVTVPDGTTAQRPGSPAVGMIRYNTDDNQFEGYSGSSPAWGAIGGGGGGGFQAELNFPMASLRVNTTLSFPPVEYVDLGTVEDYFRAFDDTTQEYVVGSFSCPSDIDASGTVTFEVYGKRSTGTVASNIYWDFDHRAVADAESGDGSYTTESSGALAVDTTTANLDRLTWTETVSNLGWTANDLILFRLSRDSADAGDTLTGDYYGWQFRILIPRA